MNDFDIDFPNFSISLSNFSSSLSCLFICSSNAVWPININKDEVKKMPMEAVREIYKRKYWDKIRGDDLPAGLDWAVFDFAVNAGVSRAAKTLQGFLATSIDGVIGSGTLQAIQDYPTTIKGVIEVFTAQRSQFYRTLKNYDTFGKGWDRRCYETRKTAVEMYVTSHLKNS